MKKTASQVIKTNTISLGAPAAITRHVRCTQARTSKAQKQAANFFFFFLSFKKFLVSDQKKVSHETLQCLYSTKSPRT